LIKDAEENEDILYGQEQAIAFMLDDLDERRLEQFLKELEEFKAKIELKKKKKNCLDALEEIHEIVKDQIQSPYRKEVRKEREEAKDEKQETAEEPSTPQVNACKPCLAGPSPQRVWNMHLPAHRPCWVFTSPRMCPAPTAIGARPIALYTIDLLGK
jgi:chemotaxis response regulator CheB